MKILVCWEAHLDSTKGARMDGDCFVDVERLDAKTLDGVRTALLRQMRSVVTKNGDPQIVKGITFRSVCRLDEPLIVEARAAMGGRPVPHGG